MRSRADGDARRVTVTTHDDPRPVEHALNADAARSLHVPPGWVERSDYVRAHRIRFPVTDRMAIGDVREKYEALMGENHWRPGHQLSPPPKGYWERDEEDDAWNFVIMDGRHRVIASLMWGFRHVLVRWNAPRDDEHARAGPADADAS